MDRFIAQLPAKADGDLMLCLDEGIAYQADRAHRVEYGEAYFEKCAGYEDGEIATKINAGRIELVRSHIGSARLVDVGIGSGEFIRKRPNTWGHDVNPKAIAWLKERDLWTPSLEGFAGASFWDVLEHVDEPEDYLRQVGLHGYVFASLPLFTDLEAIRKSRHYRPGEHLYYFLGEGFVGWMRQHGFRLLTMEVFEIHAGRDSIYSFAFKRIGWPR